MRTFLTVVLLLLSAVPPLAHSASLAEPDAQHRQLAALEGHWTVKQSLWMGSAEPKIDNGTADFALVLNGRHLRQILRINDGTGFEGLGYFGYDGSQAFSTWMDINFPGMVVAYGSAGEGAWELRGHLPDGAAVREVLTVTDASHMRYQFYETHDGAEKLAVQLDYSR